MAAFSEFVLLRFRLGARLIVLLQNQDFIFDVFDFFFQDFIELLLLLELFFADGPLVDHLKVQIVTNLAKLVSNLERL